MFEIEHTDQNYPTRKDIKKSLPDGCESTSSRAHLKRNETVKTEAKQGRYFAIVSEQETTIGTRYLGIQTNDEYRR